MLMVVGWLEVSEGNRNSLSQKHRSLHIIELFS